MSVQLLTGVYVPEPGAQKTSHYDFDGDALVRFWCSQKHFHSVNYVRLLFDCVTVSFFGLIVLWRDDPA